MRPSILVLGIALHMMFSATKVCGESAPTADRARLTTNAQLVAQLQADGLPANVMDALRFAVGRTIVGKQELREQLGKTVGAALADKYLPMVVRRAEEMGLWEIPVRNVPELQAVPSNDSCVAAISVQCGDVVNGSTTGATPEHALFCITANSSPGVWYVIVGNGDMITASTCGSSYDTKISVFRGTCVTPFCVTGNDDSCGLQSEVAWLSNPGELYFILVHGFGSAAGDFTLSLGCQDYVDGNDLCADASPIECGSTVSGTTSSATVDNVAFCGTTNTAPGVWFSVVGDGSFLRASTCGSQFDTKLSVFSGSCAGLACVGGNDDACGLQSEVTWQSLPGVVYSILLHGFGSATGLYELTVECLSLEPGTAGTCYASTGGNGTNPGSLYTVDISNGSATLIGPTGFDRMAGLACNSSGEIFGSTGASISELVRMDALSGTAISLGAIHDGANSLSFVQAIAFDHLDVLHSVDANGGFYQVDSGSGFAVPLGSTGVSPSTPIVGLTYDAGLGIFFASTGGTGGGSEQIYSIEPLTGNATLIGSLGLGAKAIPDLHLANGLLFGSANIAGIWNLVLIDKTSGAGTVIGPFGDDLRISGMTSFAPPLSLIAINDLGQSTDEDELLRIPDINTGVAEFVGSLGNDFRHTEAMAVYDPRVNGQLGSGWRIFVVDDSRLLEVDPTTGVGSFIGNIGFNDIDGIAFHNQTLYGVTYSSGKIISIDTNSGQGTVVADDVLISHRMNDLTFIGDRAFIVTDGTPKIYEVDILTGAKLGRWVLQGDPTSLESLVPALVVTGANLSAAKLWDTGTINTAPSIAFFSAGDRGSSKDLVRIVIPDDDSEVGQCAFVSQESSGYEDIEALAWIGTRVGRTLLSKTPERLATDVGNAPQPARVTLYQNRPNPFNPVTRISFELKDAGHVDMRVFDVAGRHVVTLLVEDLESGAHHVDWNGRTSSGAQAATGVYRYVLHSTSGVTSRRMVLIK